MPNKNVIGCLAKFVGFYRVFSGWFFWVPNLAGCFSSKAGSWFDGPVGLMSFFGMILGFGNWVVGCGNLNWLVRWI